MCLCLISFFVQALLIFHSFHRFKRNPDVQPWIQITIIYLLSLNEGTVMLWNIQIYVQRVLHFHCQMMCLNPNLRAELMTHTEITIITCFVFPGYSQWADLVRRLLQLLRHVFPVNVSSLSLPCVCAYRRYHTDGSSASHLANKCFFVGLWSVSSILREPLCVVCTARTVVCLYFTGSSRAGHMFTSNWRAVSRFRDIITIQSNLSFIKLCIFYFSFYWYWYI